MIFNNTRKSSRDFPQDFEELVTTEGDNDADVVRMTTEWECGLFENKNNEFFEERACRLDTYL